MYTVILRSENNDFEPVTVKNVPDGYNLVEVALDSEIFLHHNCGMVCSCSSCHILVTAGQDLLEPISQRETEFIKRAKGQRQGSRLGCQCVLPPGSGTVEVIIPNQNF